MISEFACIAKFRVGWQLPLRTCIPFLLLSCGLLSCAETQLAHHSDALNRATATTMSEHVLLNAVRASLDLPMSFTKLTKYTTENMAKGSLTPKIPFGPGAVISNDIGPAANLSSGVLSAEYVDVNTAGALAKLNQSLRYDIIHRYTSEGMSLQLTSTLFVENYYVHVKLAAALRDNLAQVCLRGTRKSPLEIRACEELFETIPHKQNCQNWWEEPQQPVMLDTKHPYWVFENHARTKCEFLKFQSFLLTLRVAGYNAELGKKETKSYEEADPTTKSSKIVPVITTSIFAEVTFAKKDVQSAAKDIADRLKSSKATRPTALIMNPRSPRSTISYLGELIALQNFSDDHFEARILMRQGEIAIFRVMRGQPSGGTALSVVGPTGEIFFVPQPHYGAPNRDQTMRVLAVISEVVNGAISEKDFPSPTSIVVRTVQ
jgi:hypothetical protein